MIQREKKLDVTKMSADQVDVLAEQIGKRMRTIADEAVEKANAFLKVYGMSAKMQLVLEHELQKPSKKKATRKKQG
jgi:hypothetical protein